MDDTRDRFLAAIADRVEPQRIVESHLFQPIRQGEYESGVAVVAVEDHAAEAGAEAGALAPDDALDQAIERNDTTGAQGARRLVVYTARYRLNIKGSERGRWHFEMHADADAPLVTVDAVVRGVQRRSGDTQDPERLTGAEFRALLPPAEPAQEQAT